MKMAVLYYSKSGNTKRMAEVIASGMRKKEGVEAKAFSIEDIDENFVKESACIVLGSPIYMSSVCGPIKSWLEGPSRTLGLAGKLGGAFATAGYVHGGGELGIRLILDHMLVHGMLTYSGGGAFGKPVIHLGPVALHDQMEAAEPVFALYGERMAEKALELFA